MPHRLLAASALLSLALVVPAEAQTTLRMAVETTPGDPLNIMITEMREALEGDEAFAVDFFEGGALGDESALTQLLRAGQVEIVPLGSDVVDLDGNFALFDIPFLFEDKAAAREALDGQLGEMLSQSLRESADLQVLGFGELGFRVISNNVRPIERPDDLSGIRLRTPGSQTRIMAFETLGAAPTPMALGEVYVALRQGALDGQENPLSVLEEFSFDEVQEYVSLTNHVYTPITLAMNGAAWDALQPEQQERLVAAAKGGVTATRETSDESDAELIAVFEEEGLQINEPDIPAFQEASRPIAERISAMLDEDFAAYFQETAQ